MGEDAVKASILLMYERESDKRRSKDCSRWRSVVAFCFVKSGPLWKNGVSLYSEAQAGILHQVKHLVYFTSLTNFILKIG